MLTSPTVDAYVDRLVSEAPSLTPAQRDAILAAFTRLRPTQKPSAR